jgi:hypothetical protein
MKFFAFAAAMLFVISCKKSESDESKVKDGETTQTNRLYLPVITHNAAPASRDILLDSLLLNIQTETCPTDSSIHCGYSVVNLATPEFSYFINGLFAVPSYSSIKFVMIGAALHLGIEDHITLEGSSGYEYCKTDHGANVKSPIHRFEEAARMTLAESNNFAAFCVLKFIEKKLVETRASDTNPVNYITDTYMQLTNGDGGESYDRHFCSWPYVPYGEVTLTYTGTNVAGGRCTRNRLNSLWSVKFLRTLYSNDNFKLSWKSRITAYSIPRYVMGLRRGFADRVFAETYTKVGHDGNSGTTFNDMALVHLVKDSKDYNIAAAIFNSSDEVAGKPNPGSELTAAKFACKVNAYFMYSDVNPQLNASNSLQQVEAQGLDPKAALASAKTAYETAKTNKDAAIASESKDLDSLKLAAKNAADAYAASAYLALKTLMPDKVFTREIAADDDALWNSPENREVANEAGAALQAAIEERVLCSSIQPINLLTPLEDP